MGYGAKMSVLLGAGLMDNAGFNSAAVASEKDWMWMARALRLAERGIYTTMPNPAVGCVLVKDGRVVGEGFHRKAGSPHAEIEALQAAGGEGRGADCYVTLEPCAHHGRTPPCVLALIEGGVKRVIYAHGDPNPQVDGRGAEILREAGIEVESGILAEEARELNRGFVMRMREARPFVHLKLAISLDGRVALANGESRWISSEQSRRDVQRLRARSAALLTGIGTVLQDDPQLTLRDPRFQDPRPPLVKAVLDSELRATPDLRLFQSGDPVLLYCREGVDRARGESLRRRGAEIVPLPKGGDGRLDLLALLRDLARREMNEAMIEAGPTLAASFLSARLVDELTVYSAPCCLGDRGIGALRLPQFERIADCPRLTLREMRQIGPDWRFTARLEKEERCLPGS